MSIVLQRSFIFIALLIAGLVFYSLWFGIRADRYEETAVPYLESALPKLISWRYRELEPLLSPEARLVFESKEVRAAYRSYSRLGQFKSAGKPQYIGNSSDSSSTLGDVELIAYQIQLEFDSGPAMIKINLITSSESYTINHFGIHSEIFTDEKTGD